MPGKELDKRIHKLLDQWAGFPACDWCKDQNSRLLGKRAPLCGSCYRIAAEIRKCEKLAAPYNGQPSHIWNPFRDRVRVALERKADAVRVGRMQDEMYRQQEPLALEKLLREIGRIAVRKDLFSNDATLLGHNFSGEQRRLLSVIWFRIIREHRRKTRTYRAMNKAED